MNALSINHNQLKSLKIVVEYLLENEQKHYEECSLNNKVNHIYRHTKILDNILNKKKFNY